MKKVLFTLLCFMSISFIGLNVANTQVRCDKKDVTCYRGERCDFPIQGFYCDGLDSSGTECTTYWACGAIQE